MREQIGINSQESSSRFPIKAQETLSGNRTISFNEVERFQAFDFDPGGGARDVTLPAEAACKGSFLYFYNSADAAENLVIKNDGAGTIVTVGQGKAGVVWCDGTNWRGLLGA